MRVLAFGKRCVFNVRLMSRNFRKMRADFSLSRDSFNFSEILPKNCSKGTRFCAIASAAFVTEIK